MICHTIVLLIGLSQLAQISLGQKVKIVDVGNLPSDIDLDVALFENLILVDENHPHIKQLIDVFLVPYLHLIDEKFKTTSQTKISVKKVFDNQPTGIQERIHALFMNEEDKIDRKTAEDVIRVALKSELENLSILSSQAEVNPMPDENSPINEIIMTETEQASKQSNDHTSLKYLIEKALEKGLNVFEFEENDDDKDNIGARGVVFPSEIGNENEENGENNHHKSDTTTTTTTTATTTVVIVVVFSLVAIMILAHRLLSLFSGRIVRLRWIPFSYGYNNSANKLNIPGRR